MAQPAAANPSFHAVLRKQSRLCTAACACAPSTAWSNATRPISVTEYLSSVYPAARGRFRSPLTLFNSLHFYWDVAPWRSAACATEGAHLRFLWHDLTPCFQQMRPPDVLDDGSVRFKCAARQAAFSPSWALRAAQSNWLEIEHRAAGVVGRAVPSLAGKPAAADELSGMLDPGVAGMWHIYRRGSGLWYRMGRTASAPSKGAVLVALLLEMHAASPQLAQAWERRMRRSALLDGWLRDHSILRHATAINETVQGRRRCSEAGVRACRCDLMLGDEWDDALTWAARARGYESLFLYAAVLTGACGPSEQSTQVNYQAAFAEIVDLRLPEPSWLPAQQEGRYPFLQRANPNQAGLLISRAKTASAAKLWLAAIASERRFALRDPSAPDDDERALPCHLSRGARTLRCDGHAPTAPSALPPGGRGWDACSRATCGEGGERWRKERRTSVR